MLQFLKFIEKFKNNVFLVAIKKAIVIVNVHGTYIPFFYKLFEKCITAILLIGTINYFYIFCKFYEI